MKHFGPFLFIFLFAVCGLAFGGQEVTLKVLDPQDLPVPGAFVEARTSGDQISRVSATANSDGLAILRFDTPAEIRIAAPGFEPFSQTVESVTSGELTLELKPATVYTTLEVVVRAERLGTEPSVGSAVEIDQSGARTVLDAVEKLVPSAFVTRRGVMGYGIATHGTGGVSVRGIGGSPNTGILVVVDGRPDFQGLMGHPLPDFYSLSDTGSVSVTQGPASVLYGSNAMGGVVEIKPSVPSEGFETRLSTSLGSYMTGQHRVSHSGRFERSFYSAKAGVSHTSGDRPSSVFRSQDGSLALGYDLSPVWRASLRGRYGHFHVEDPGPVYDPLSDSYARVGRGGFSLNLDNAAGRQWGYARLYSSYGHHILTDGFRSVDNTTGARLHQFYEVSPQLTLEGGSDVVSYGGRGRDVRSGVDYGDHRLTTVAGFSRLQWDPDLRVRLYSGFRYDHNSQLGAIAVPEFGISYRLAQGYSISAAIARGFRNPTLRELYLFPAPNPDLLPESMWNYQATVQASPAANLQVLATFYYADLKDMIVTTGRYPILELQNTGNALNRGWEGNIRWRLLRRLSVNAGYAYLRSTNIAPLVPAHKLNYAMELSAGRTYLQISGVSVNSRWSDTRRTQRLGGYTVTSLKYIVPAGQRYSFSVMLDNLFDKRYEVLSGYPMPGINVMFGLNIRM